MVDIIGASPRTQTKDELLYEPKIRQGWSIGSSISSIKQRNVTWKIGFVHFDSENVEVGDCVFLSLARTKCDLLIACIPSDLALRLQKKKYKWTMQERAFSLASLSVVDYIVPYDEEIPSLILTAVNPDIIFSGRLEDENNSWSNLSKIKIENISYPFQVREINQNRKFFQI